jgi:hypothetical protein
MNCIEDNFNKVLLIQIVGFSISVCLQGYHIVLVSNIIILYISKELT